jgi:hypothetical protein
MKGLSCMNGSLTFIQAPTRSDSSQSLQYLSMLHALRSSNTTTSKSSYSLLQMVSNLRATDASSMEQVRRLQPKAYPTRPTAPTSKQSQPCSTNWYNRQLLIDASRNTTNTGIPLNLLQLVNSDQAFQQISYL